MAVVTNIETEYFLCKTIKGHIYAKVVVRNKVGRIECWIRMYRIRNVNQKARQTGANVSRPESGNTPMGNTVHGNGNMTTNLHLNYYGSNYANASSTATQQMDPNAFTKPIADVLNGPSLKSPNVEECGYSDRIMQLTLGNSTITTQEAANAVVAYGKWPSKAAGMGEAIDKSSEPGTAACRFYTLTSVDWGTSNNQGWFWKFPDILKDQGIMGQNLNYHYLYRTGYVVHVQCNASKFHAGALFVGMIPECELQSMEDATTNSIPTDFFTTYPREQNFVFPHQIINLRTNNCATIIVPYISPNPMENPASHNNWTLVVYPLAILSYTTGASTTLGLTVSVAPMETQFNGLRSAAFQGIPTTYTIGSGQFVTTLRDVGIPVYPTFEPTDLHDIPGEFVNFLEPCRVGTLVTFKSSGATYNLDISNQAPGAQLFSWQLDLNQSWAASTYVARMAKFFVNYRGSLKLSFTFTGSALTTAKILLCYTPPGTAAPTNREEAMLSTSLVWDVGLQSTATLVIPWISETQYRMHNQGFKFTTAGYVSGWMQTRMIYPPGTATTARIFATLAAGDDFCFRIATDDAFYQGDEGEPGRPVNGPLHEREPQRVSEASTTAPPVSTGQSAALNAAETGQTSDATAASVMEVRTSSCSFSALSSSVENLLSRYALLYEDYRNYGRYSDTGYFGSAIQVPVTFESIQATAGVRAKFAAMTYSRFDLDLVVQVEVHQAVYQNLPTDYLVMSGPFQFQMLYTPPGLEAPPLELSDIQNSDARWFQPTTPSVYFKDTDPPANVRIPFVGIASVYANFYDGRATLDEDGQYGEFPGNTLGHIYVRPLWKPAKNPEGIFGVRYRVFARPVNIRAWCPRPLVTFKTSTTRILRTINVMPKRGSPLRLKHWDNKQPKTWMEDVVRQLPVVHTKDGPMYATPITEELAVAPYHWVVADYIGNESRYRMVWADKDHDLCCFKYDSDWVPKFCTCTKGYWSINRCMFDKVKFFKFASWMDELEVESDTVGDHMQRDLIQVSKKIPEGWCGSPLFCEHGICGIATASTDSTGFFTHLASVPHFPLTTSKWDAEEQGPLDWFQDAIANMGAIFGNGFSDAVRDRVNEACDSIPDVKDDVTKTTILMLIKAICACVLISRSYNPGETAACVGIMLGVDLLGSSPFEWLKQQLSKALGCPIAEEQGFVDWVKDFNACATAAKSLEWVGQKN